MINLLLLTWTSSMTNDSYRLDLIFYISQKLPAPQPHIPNPAPFPHFSLYDYYDFTSEPSSFQQNCSTSPANMGLHVVHCGMGLYMYSDTTPKLTQCLCESVSPHRALPYYHEPQVWSRLKRPHDMIPQKPRHVYLVPSWWWV